MTELLTSLFAGSWPLLTIMLSEDTGLNVNVEQNVKGVPSYKTVTFAYKGLRAPPVSVDATSTEVNSHDYWQNHSCFVLCSYIFSYVKCATESHKNKLLQLCSW